MDIAGIYEDCSADIDGKIWGMGRTGLLKAKPIILDKVFLHEHNLSTGIKEELKFIDS